MKKLFSMMFMMSCLIACGPDEFAEIQPADAGETSSTQCQEGDMRQAFLCPAPSIKICHHVDPNFCDCSCSWPVE
jgi:hypothetical protein